MKTIKKTTPYKCKICLIDFMGTSYSKRVFCSKKCQYAANILTYKECAQCKKDFRVTPYNAKTRVHCSYDCRSASTAYKEQLSAAGKRRVEKYNYIGENNPNWRGGTTAERHRFMSRKTYKDWRKSVYERDGYRCVFCGVAGNGKNLQADHIKPYITHPDLRLDINNGRTLCIDCHKTTDTYGWKTFNAMRKMETV